MDELQTIINHKFKNAKLLEEALSHKSFSKNNNERLEFLGDSILGAIIANYLFSRFPKLSEGKLTRMKSNLVKGATLSEIALEIKLDKFIKLGKGEIKDKGKNSGRKNKSTLENATEALFGAIFLDSDFKTTEQIILDIYQTRLGKLNPDDNLKDNKSRLQELLQQQKLKLPVYKLIKTKGKDHNATFVVEAEVMEYKIKVIQEGKSIKIAEQNCAKILLDKINQKIKL